MDAKKLFPRASEVAYLDTAAEGLPHPQCEEALREYYRAKSQGTPGRGKLFAVEDETLGLAGRLLGTDPANVAFLPSASDALSFLAASIDWKPADQVIISDLEFPSNVFPWLRVKQKGVEVIVVPSDNGTLAWERVAEKISPRTRVVSLSVVSYRTGTYFRFVREVAAEAKKWGAIVAVDATQAVGRCPVSLEGVDYLVSSTFKWLIGPHGLAIVYLSPELRERFQPAYVGWYSVKDPFSTNFFESYELKEGAACMPVGMPNFPSIYGLQRSLEFLLGIGIEKIYQDLRPAIQRLRQGLTKLRLDLLTPDDGGCTSGIVCFAHAKAEELSNALEKQGVIVRGSDGRVRASIHVYNDIADVDRYLQALAGLLP
jgi:selenocysteine lyase/cysteine desulfurase